MNVRTLCLGILSIKEASGYEIKKEIEDGMFSHFIDASYGSIYPALTQLSLEGLLTVRAEEQSGRPDKKVYAITDEGRVALKKGLAVLPARDKFKSEFLFEMLLQDHLLPGQIDMIVAKQYAELSEDLERITIHASHKCSDSTDIGPRFVLGYGENVLRAGLAYLEAQYPSLKQIKLKAAE